MKTETLLNDILEKARAAKSLKVKEYPVSDMWVATMVMSNAVDIEYKVRTEHYKRIQAEMEEILKTKSI